MPSDAPQADSGKIAARRLRRRPWRLIHHIVAFTAAVAMPIFGHFCFFTGLGWVLWLLWRDVAPPLLLF